MRTWLWVRSIQNRDAMADTVRQTIRPFGTRPSAFASPAAPVPRVSEWLRRLLASHMTRPADKTAPFPAAATAKHVLDGPGPAHNSECRTRAHSQSGAGGRNRQSEHEHNTSPQDQNANEHGGVLGRCSRTTPETDAPPQNTSTPMQKRGDAPGQQPGVEEGRTANAADATLAPWAPCSTAGRGRGGHGSAPVVARRRTWSAVPSRGSSTGPSSWCQGVRAPVRRPQVRPAQRSFRC